MKQTIDTKQKYILELSLTEVQHLSTLLAISDDKTLERMKLMCSTIINSYPPCTLLSTKMK